MLVFVRGGRGVAVAGYFRWCRSGGCRLVVGLSRFRARRNGGSSVPSTGRLF
jgi:hypothetical protein